MSSLTVFKFDILATLNRQSEPVHGLGIKSTLEEDMGYGEIGHGRLYPNLDELVRLGFVEKGTIDQRTNSYEITADGNAAIRERIAQLKQE